MVRKTCMTIWEMVCLLLRIEYKVEGAVRLNPRLRIADQFYFCLQKFSSYSKPVEAFAWDSIDGDHDPQWVELLMVMLLVLERDSHPDQGHTHIVPWKGNIQLNYDMRSCTRAQLVAAMTSRSLENLVLSILSTFQGIDWPFQSAHLFEGGMLYSSWG